MRRWTVRFMDPRLDLLLEVESAMIRVLFSVDGTKLNCSSAYEETDWETN